MQDRFQRTVVEAFDLPQPLTDTVVNGFEVDNVWLDQKVIAELDGWDFHRDRHHFVRDRERDAVHADHGFVVLRVTWERLQQPEREAERLLRILRRRGYAG